MRTLSLLWLLLAACCAMGDLPGAETDRNAFEGRCALSAKLPVTEPGVHPPAPESDHASASWHLQAELADCVGHRRAGPDPSDAASDPHLDETTRQRRLEAVQQLQTKVELAHLDLKSVEAEVRCERERAEHLADALQNRRQHTVKLLTVGAIIAGAVFGLGAGSLFLAGVDVAGSSLSITGGLISTILATTALRADERAELRYRRNILRELWEGPDEPEIMVTARMALSDTAAARGPRAAFLTRDARTGLAASVITGEAALRQGTKENGPVHGSRRGLRLPN